MISRSQPELVTQHESKALIEAINQAFEGEPPTAEEKNLLQGIRTTQRKLLESELSRQTRDDASKVKGGKKNPGA